MAMSCKKKGTVVTVVVAVAATLIGYVLGKKKGVKEGSLAQTP